jgi:Helix-turn-helix domain
MVGCCGLAHRDKNLFTSNEVVLMSAMINAEGIFALQTGQTFPSKENYTHDAVFGQLTDAAFAVDEAADYLQVSIATFRCYVRDGKIKAASEVGTSHLYALEGLREFKNALKLVK